MDDRFLHSSRLRPTGGKRLDVEALRVSDARLVQPTRRQTHLVGRVLRGETGLTTRRPAADRPRPDDATG